MDPNEQQINETDADSMEVSEVTVGRFRGNFPVIPTADGVDMEALRGLDEDPFFVTLPVVPKVGQVSGNGILYDNQLLDTIGEQINTKRPSANFGHLTKEQRDTGFQNPVAFWVGAKRVDDTLWGKAYVLPGEDRVYMERLKALNGQISTSIHGSGNHQRIGKGKTRLTSFNLDYLDFAHPSRAALGGGSTPAITSETMGGEDDPATAGTTEGSIMDKQELIAELTVADVPAALRDAIVQEAGEQAGQEAQIAELTQAVEDRDVQLAAAATAVAEYRERDFAAKLDTMVSELIDWEVTGEDATAKFDALKRTLRSRIVSELADKREDDDIKEASEIAWAELKPIAETVRDALAGPPAIVGSGNGKRTKLEDTPQARAEARAAFNF